MDPAARGAFLLGLDPNRVSDLRVDSADRHDLDQRRALLQLYTPSGAVAMKGRLTGDA